MANPIEDYALIGDLETAALVCRNGSIDWLCLPRFDSGACFAALLGEPEHGRWLIAPVDSDASVQRRYRGDTLVLETEFTTPGGTVRVIDFMPPRGAVGTGQHDLIRIVEGVDGRVDMEMELMVRFDYGSVTPWTTMNGDVLRAVAGPDSITLFTPVNLEVEAEASRARFQVAVGDRVPFVFAWMPSHLPPPDAADAEEALRRTEKWWQDWSENCQFQGEHRDLVMRSLITLKGLTYAPTGGIVAAPTTSLPELIGGERNWDYRYVWLRDATFTLYALSIGGFEGEAMAWRDWLLRAAAGSPEDLRIMYGLGGERRLPELHLSWLPGYEGSRPVRVGNEAHRQFQIDTFGEVIDALHVARRRGLEPEEEAWTLQLALLEFLEGNWQRDDHGLWEVRGPARPFTHSRLMSWVAFDRAVKTVDRTRLDGPVDRWRSVRDEIRSDIMTHGYDSSRNTFVQSYGSEALDAALLLIPQVGFLEPTDERVVGTVDAVLADLSLSEDLIRRYRTEQADDGLAGHEGAFIICSFWMVDALALMGRREEARRRFDGLVGLANDVGLMAEEYDPVAGRMLGNFPQAFSHVGLIDSADTLVDRHRTPAGTRGEVTPS